MKDALVNNDTSVEQELETALARMFRPEEGVNAQAWVNWLNQTIDTLPLRTELHKRSVHRLRDLCGRSGSLPEAYFLAHDITLLDNNPVSHGGFSDVYRGLCAGRPVALKVLRVSSDDQEDVKKAFCQEVVVWKRLSHPNILPFWGVSRASPLSLVSPWMTHGSIRSYIKRNPDNDRKPWLIDIANGLNYMHSMGIVHGDLKSQNILLNNELHACLADFGLAGVHTIGLTTANGLRGSIRWMSPELLGIDGVHSKLTTQSDIWALGVVWWEIMTGLMPYHELSIDVQVITKLIQKKLLPLPEDLNPILSTTMKDCWQWDPQHRPTASGVLQRVLKASKAPTPIPDSEVKQQLIIINQEIHPLEKPAEGQSEQLYRGWVHQVLAPLSAFIDENVDPRQSYVDLQEIGAGGHGSVFTARPSVDALGISKHRHVDKSPSALAAIVAIKIIPVDPAGSPKIEQLKTELDIMRGIQNPHVLTLDMLFIDLVDDALWIRMEFMEWSLTDVIALADEGAEMSEAVIARFTADALSALEYLKPMNIAHRDVRSDNMLINSAGVLKLADFDLAVRVQPDDPPCTEAVGVLHWQAPEVRSGFYDPLKVDVYSVGATAWEMAQHIPPFSELLKPEDFRLVGHQWPELDNADEFSRHFHDFLRLCSMPAASRPDAKDLLHTSFIRGAVPRTDIVLLLATCITLEGG